MLEKIKRLLTLIAKGMKYSSVVNATGGNISTSETFGIIRG